MLCVKSELKATYLHFTKKFIVVFHILMDKKERIVYNKNKIKFTLFGIIFGLLFPIGAIFTDLLLFQNLIPNIDNIKNLYVLNPMHYIIGTAPLFLGIAFFFIGKYIDASKILILILERKVNERTKNLQEANEELQASEEEIRQSLETNVAIQQELEDQHNLLERSNLNLTKSINAAKRIQDALLPHECELNHIPQHFCIYKPKDSVSGDFYFVMKRNYKLYVAVGDCTGHGVPGALLSVMGMEELKRIIALHDSIDPAEILRYLDKHFKDTLMKNSEKGNLKEGMELSICAIDQFPVEMSGHLGKPQMKFAATNQKMMLIEGDECKVFNGVKRPIGGSAIYQKYEFESHSIPLTDNTKCYLMSDGYPDQFGEKTDRKFMFKKLQDLIFENRNRSFSEMEDVLCYNLKKWQGKRAQVDDITVLGFSPLGHIKLGS